MILHTASEGVSFAKRLEEESAQFYQDLARRFGDNAEVFETYAKENKKYAANVQTTYYGVITDAIEGCYCFDIDEDNYVIDTSLTDGASYADAVKRALEIEAKIIRYYSDAAEQSRPLMADVPRAFSIIAKKRNRRVDQLKSLGG